MIRRLLAAVFGALIFALVVPLSWWLAVDTLPLGDFRGVLLLIGVGGAIGACLGALHPKVFGFIFVLFLEVGNS